MSKTFYFFFFKYNQCDPCKKHSSLALQANTKKIYMNNFLYSWSLYSSGFLLRLLLWQWFISNHNPKLAQYCNKVLSVKWTKTETICRQNNFLSVSRGLPGNPHFLKKSQNSFFLILYVYVNSFLLHISCNINFVIQIILFLRSDTHNTTYDSRQAL